MTTPMTTTTQATGRDHHTTLGGIRFHHRTAGDAAAPPVVVLHGIMGHSREWDVLVASLATRHRVVALDQRGHGETGWADDYTVSAMADDVVALVEELGLHRAAVIGHSMGGMAAMVAAARRPELVSRLVVIDVGPDTVGGELADGLKAFVGHLGSASYASVDEAYAEWSSNPLAHPDHLRHYVEHCLVARADGRLEWRFDGIGLTRFFDGVEPAQLWDAVDAITCPTLLVRGEHSPALAPSSADEVIRRLADARLVVIPDGGHDLGVEQPQAVAAAVEEFLRSTGPAGISPSGSDAVPSAGGSPLPRHRRRSR